MDVCIFQRSLWLLCRRHKQKQRCAQRQSQGPHEGSWGLGGVTMKMGVLPIAGLCGLHPSTRTSSSLLPRLSEQPLNFACVLPNHSHIGSTQNTTWQYTLNYSCEDSAQYLSHPKLTSPLFTHPHDLIWVHEMHRVWLPRKPLLF